MRFTSRTKPLVLGVIYYTLVNSFLLFFIYSIKDYDRHFNDIVDARGYKHAWFELLVLGNTYATIVAAICVVLYLIGRWFVGFVRSR